MCGYIMFDDDENDNLVAGTGICSGTGTGTGNDTDNVVGATNIDKILKILTNKISIYENIITKTRVNSDNYLKLGILTTVEINTCLGELNSLLTEVRRMDTYLSDSDTAYDVDEVINDIQLINNRLSSVMQKYGTRSVEDLVYVCLGNDYLENFDSGYADKFALVKKHLYPTSYKLISDASLKKGAAEASPANAILEDFRICETGSLCSCYEFSTPRPGMYLNAAKVLIKDASSKQNLIIYGYLDELTYDYISTNPFAHEKFYSLKQMRPSNNPVYDYRFDTYLESLNLKDYLIHTVDDIYERYVGYLCNVRAVKSRSLSQVVNDFLKAGISRKRDMLIQLLIHSNDNESMYLAYLLYDTLSDEDGDKVSIQDTIYNSLPWVIKSKFKCAMKKTIDYTNALINYDVSNNLPIEQRICLMKCSDKVKEKAMVKLKEVKSKTDDSATKSRQYLDGLLNIPFGIYKREQIFDVIDDNQKTFSQMLASVDQNYVTGIDKKDTYNGVEIKTHSRTVLERVGMETFGSKMTHIRTVVATFKKKRMLAFICEVHRVLLTAGLIGGVAPGTVNRSPGELRASQKEVIRDRIYKLLDFVADAHAENDVVGNTVLDSIIRGTGVADAGRMTVFESTHKIFGNNSIITKYMAGVRERLDESVYGHVDAKRQVERIIGQWITGKDGGYCLGFEGPPGVGKTSLAKHGLSKCLVDENGVSRPFSFIAIGGSSNGSTLEGHNYTYVGSTWGRVVDILMEQKCMNPIIFIDEIDKVSKTENGRELISILTHLVDPTQNDSFQDKYFSGIDIDVSKVLFVFSYNDVSMVDRILLDRIHRIRFDNLTMGDKIVICNRHMLPELLDKMGQTGNIVFPDDVLKSIINSYTLEAGVRKLKELLYEIIGEINLDMLNDLDGDIHLPIVVTESDVATKYLKDRHKMDDKKVTPVDKIGVISGLYANALGRGGVIPIETKMFVTKSLLDLKLTGQQGDVMKESMAVAKTLAWGLTSPERQSELMTEFERTCNQGIHIHCPEGATPKDGPSAGTAITVALYSLLNKIPIKYDLALTGEINLQGCVTAIGGLDLKIVGGINMGVKTFLYPNENKKDFDKFMEKYADNSITDGIAFHGIDTIDDALAISLVR